MNPLRIVLAEPTAPMTHALAANMRQHGQRAETPQQQHDSSDEDGQELPSFDGTLTNLNSWLDDLNDSEHLLDAEIVTLLSTGCAISRSGKIVACSHAHAHLKAAGILESAGFNILNPPPLDDGFAAY